MIRCVWSAVVGFALGAVVVLGVSLSVDGRSEREDKLAADLSRAQQRCETTEANLRDIVSKSELRLKTTTANGEARTAELQQRITDLEVKVKAIPQLEKNLTIANQSKYKLVAFTTEEAIAAINKELTVTRSKDENGSELYQIANGKVMAMATRTADGRLRSFMLLGAASNVVDFARAFGLLLAGIEAESHKSSPDFGTWFADSLVFAGGHRHSTVRRTFGQHTVTIGAAGDWSRDSVYHLVMAAVDRAD